MATQKRWEAAVVAGEARVNNPARSLRGIKAAFGRGELGAADFHRKIADRIDAETATLSRMFVDNCRRTAWRGSRSRRRSCRRS